MKIVYTNTAQRDLREIYNYIVYTLLVPDTAKAISEKILAAEISAANWKKLRNGNLQLPARSGGELL